MPASRARYVRAAVVLTGLLLGSTGLASAQPWGYGAGPPPPRYETPYNQTPGIDRRQAQQREWLREGEASGRPTRREADRIRYALRELEQHERAAKADGYVSPAERRALRDHAERVDAMISRNYYDGEARPPRYGEIWR